MRILGVLVAALVAGAVVALLAGIATVSPHTVELAPILMLAGGLLALVRALFMSAIDGPVPLVGGIALMVAAFVARHDGSGKALLLGFAVFAIAAAAGKTRSTLARIAGVIAALAPLIVIADASLYWLAGAVYLMSPASLAVDALRAK